MRQIYTSPRVENIDRVVAMLGEAGIETSVTNRRNWGANTYQRPSYTGKQNPDSWPQPPPSAATATTAARTQTRRSGPERIAPSSQHCRSA